MYREVGITYCVPPFLKKEEKAVRGMVPIVYYWHYRPTGRRGTHIVFIFPEDEKRFPSLLAHWNRTENWHYSLANPVSI